MTVLAFEADRPRRRRQPISHVEVRARALHPSIAQPYDQDTDISPVMLSTALSVLIAHARRTGNEQVRQAADIIDRQARKGGPKAGA